MTSKPSGSGASPHGDVFAGSQMAMLLLDPDSGAIVDANPAAAAFYGHNVDELRRMSLSDLAASPEAVLAALREGGPALCRPSIVRHRLASGECREVEVQCAPVDLPARRVILATIRDASSRGQGDEALEHSELTHRIVAENAYDWEYWQSPDGGLLYCSPSCERITGYERDEFLQDPNLLERIVFADDLPRFHAHRLEECTSGLAAMEYRITAKDGTVRWLEHVCQPVYAPDGTCLGTRVSNRDATGRKLMEQERALLLSELRAARQRAEEMAAYLERERDILHAVMENTSTQLAYFDAHFNFVAVNTAYVEDCGHSRDALIGRNHFELYPNEENQAIFEHVRDSGRPVRFFEKPFEYADQPERGVTYWDWSLVPVGEPGNVRGLVLSLADATDRVRARRRIEELAAEAQHRAGTLAATIASIADAVVVYGPTGEIVSLNPVAEALLGYTAEELSLPIHARLENLNPTAEAGQNLGTPHYPAIRALRGETVQPETFSMTLKGVRRWVAVSAAPIRDADGIVTGAVAVMRDVTEARAAQQRLEQRNEDLRVQRERLAALTQELEAERARLTATITSAPQAIVVTDALGKVLISNPVADRMYGNRSLQGQNVLEMTDVSLTDSDGRPYLPESLPPVRSAREGTAFSGVNVSMSLAGGGRRDLVISSAPIRDRQDQVTGAVAVIEDVTERRQAERERERLLALVEATADELQEANARLQSQTAELQAQKDELLEVAHDLRAEHERLMVTLRSIGDGVMATDAQGLVRLMNPVAEALTGWKEVDAIGRPLQDVFAAVSERTGEPLGDLLRRGLEGAAAGPAEHWILTAKGGEQYVVSHNVAPIKDGAGGVLGAVLVFQDATERRRLEEEVTRTNKLEALGLLAAGIAHDFNNLLTAISGNVVLARLESSDNRDVIEILTEAEKAAARARELTQQLLVFSRGGAPVRRPLHLAELLAQASGFALRGSKSRCELSVAPGLWSVRGDEEQIGQVIQNLVLNADEAMPGGGTIVVAAENVSLTGADDPPLPAGAYVKVSVSDHGVGIRREDLSKVFDPYFTTKQKGRGLGLASCYSIVRRHEGHISVESELGFGSTFTVYLPAAGPVELAEPAPDAGAMYGHGRVLVMDDEQVVRTVLQRMLARLGYEVHCVAEGGEAVAAYKQALESDRPFDIAILDLTVPGGMGGLEAMSHLRAIDPRVRAIVSSGYSNDPVMAEYRRHGFAGVMSKPYRIEDLGLALNRVLRR